MALAFKRFMAGFLATLIFHQGVIAALWAAKVIPIAPFSMKLVAPLAVPSGRTSQPGLKVRDARLFES